MNYRIFIPTLLLLLLFSACEPDTLPPFKTIAKDIILVASVPTKAFANITGVTLDATETEKMNGTRSFNFLWTCTVYPPNKFPTIDKPTKALTNVINLSEGKYEFNLKVWDDAGNQSTRSFPMEVMTDTLSKAPVLVPMSDQTIQLPQNEVYLDASLIGAANQLERKLFFKWTVIEEPANSKPVVMYITERITTSALIRSPGIYRIKLDVRNEIGLTASDTVTIEMFADPLSGKEKIYENLIWIEGLDEWDPYPHVFIKETDTYKYRSTWNTEVTAFDVETQEPIDPNLIDWYGQDEGLIVYVYNSNLKWYPGKKVRIIVKYL